MKIIRTTTRNIIFTSHFTGKKATTVVSQLTFNFLSKYALNQKIPGVGRKKRFCKKVFYRAQEVLRVD